MSLLSGYLRSFLYYHFCRRYKAVNKDSAITGKVKKILKLIAIPTVFPFY